MTTKKITSLIILGVIALLVGWDIFVAVEPTDGDTISEIVLDFSRKNPFIMLASGVLLGHLFWPQKAEEKTPTE